MVILSGAVGPREGCPEAQGASTPFLAHDEDHGRESTGSHYGVTLAKLLGFHC